MTFIARRRVAIALMAFLPHAAAFKVRADGVAWTKIVVSGILALIFLAEIVLACMSLYRAYKAKGRRTAPAMLFSVTVLMFVASLSDIPLVIIDNVTPLPQMRLRPTLDAVKRLCTFWATALLFLVVVLMLQSSYAVELKVSAGGLLRKLNVVLRYMHYILFSSMMITGTIAGAELARFDSGLYAHQRRLAKSYNVFRNAQYAFHVFWSLSVAYLAMYSSLSYVQSRRANILPRVVKLMLFVVSPLFATYFVVSFAFVVIFSGVMSYQTYERISLASLSLQGLLMSIIVLTVLIMVIKRSDWETQASAELRNIFAYMGAEAKPKKENPASESIGQDQSTNYKLPSAKKLPSHPHPPRQYKPGMF